MHIYVHTFKILSLFICMFATNKLIRDTRLSLEDLVVIAFISQINYYEIREDTLPHIGLDLVLTTLLDLVYVHQPLLSLHHPVILEPT